MYRKVLTSLVIFTTAFSAWGGPLEWYAIHQQEPQLPPALTSHVSEYYFQQWVDHHQPNLGMFKQRYVIDESYSNDNNDPVFFLIGGEGAMLRYPFSGAIREHAKAFHAKLVAIEHRYYGASLPRRSFSTADLQYLNTQAALDDLAYFQQQLTQQKQWTGKWVAFGGSYSGSLSAYYRLQHPELVVGALASSAPVRAKADFFEYDQHIAKVAGPDCAGKMREAVAEVEAALSNRPRLEKIKTLFSASAVNDDVDFLYLIADVGAVAVQYGMVDQFCRAMTDDEHTALENYAEMANLIYYYFSIAPLSLTPQGAMSENPNDYDDRFGIRPWYYQSCTEYGYWQNANPDPTATARSQRINAAYHQAICQRLFGITTPADTDHINNTYYLPLMNPAASNIYFTNGSNDPWSKLSMTVDNGNVNNTNLFYKLIMGTAHCDDLRASKATDPADLVEAREQLRQLIASWL